MPGILDPIKIGFLQLRNRLVMPPMATGLATAEGEVTPALVDHYVQRSKVPGLIIVEHSYVLRSGKLSPKQLGIHDDKLIPKLKKLVSAVQEEGASVAIQVNHAGAKASSEICDQQPVAPSPITLSTEQARQLTPNEIGEIVKAFVQAAQRAFDAGFDAVEVHGAHGFLLNQFNSPLCNTRTDMYGGSLENRTRISVEILRGIREKLGKNYPLLYRLGADDGKPEGINSKIGQAIAKILEKNGVDIIDVSGGLMGSILSNQKQGYFIPLAHKIKRAVNIPVVGVGGITSLEFADKIIREGMVDLVAVGRAMLYDSEWATKEVKVLQK